MHEQPCARDEHDSSALVVKHAVRTIELQQAQEVDEQRVDSDRHPLDVVQLRYMGVDERPIGLRLPDRLRRVAAHLDERAPEQLDQLIE